MWPIFIKEVRTVFSDTIGFLAIGLFLTLSALFLWLLEGSFNIIQAGFADLTLFFELAPWLLFLVVPTLSMRSFSEEIKSGTLELMLTKPIGVTALVWGKFLGLLFVGIMALLPTLGYVYLLHTLLPEGNTLDIGMLWGGYLGLFLFVSMLTALSVLMSSLSRQQTTAFILALFVGFSHFYLWGQLANVSASFYWYDWIASIGMQSHYSSLNRGVIRLEDVAYFLGGTLLFLMATQYRIRLLQSQ